MCKPCTNMAGGGILAVSVSSILYRLMFGQPPTIWFDMNAAIIGIAFGILISVQRSQST